MRVVLDTVIFVRALISPSGGSGRLLFERSNQYVNVLSPAIAVEIIDVINRPNLEDQLKIDIPRVARIISIIEAAEVVQPRRSIKVCRDPNDDKFFECAVEGRASYIVSEDKDILDIGEYKGIRTLTAEAFLRILNAT